MLTVAAAIIVRQGRILAAQRSPFMRNPLKWEFPGGKLERGESPEDCIHREIREELGVSIRIKGNAPAVRFPLEAPQIELLPFLAEVVAGEPVPTEHMRIDWFLPAELPGLDWTAPDLPIVQWCLDNPAYFQVNE